MRQICRHVRVEPCLSCWRKKQLLVTKGSFPQGCLVFFLAKQRVGQPPDILDPSGDNPPPAVFAEQLETMISTAYLSWKWLKNMCFPRFIALTCVLLSTSALMIARVSCACVPVSSLRNNWKWSTSRGLSRNRWYSEVAVASCVFMFWNSWCVVMGDAGCPLFMMCHDECGSEVDRSFPS